MLRVPSGRMRSCSVRSGGAGTAWGCDGDLVDDVDGDDDAGAEKELNHASSSASACCSRGPLG